MAIKVETPKEKAVAVKVEIPKEKAVAVTTPGISSTMKGADGHSPYISATGTWMVWDDTQHVWVDTNVKAHGEDAYTPIKGVDYFDGKDGYTPVKGVDYFDGRDGDPGYTPQKGIDYNDGYTPIKGVDYNDGYTPVKGVDYFTAGDKAELVDVVKDSVQPSVSQLSNQIINQGERITTLEQNGSKDNEIREIIGDDPADDNEWQAVITQLADSIPHLSKIANLVAALPEDEVCMDIVVQLQHINDNLSKIVEVAF